MRSAANGGSGSHSSFNLALAEALPTHLPPTELQTPRRITALPLSRLTGNPLTLDVMCANVPAKALAPHSDYFAAPGLPDERRPLSNGGLSHDAHSNAHDGPSGPRDSFSAGPPVAPVGVPLPPTPLTASSPPNSCTDTPPAVVSSPEPPHPFPSQASPSSSESPTLPAVAVSSAAPTSPSRATTPRQQSPHPRSAAAPSTRPRSMNSLLTDATRAQDRERALSSELSDMRPLPSTGARDTEADAVSHAPTASKEQNQFKTRWSNLEDLIDKALFKSVSAPDDPFIKHFLLTHRKFATPRAVLLGVQRRLRILESKAATDPMLSSFAQFRICGFLKTWTRDYPADFMEQGADAALSAIVKNLASRTNTLYQGIELMPFVEILGDPALSKELTAGQVTWGVQEHLPGEDSDSAHVIEEEGEEEEEEDDDAPVMVEHPRMSMTAEYTRANGVRALSDAELPASSMSFPPSALRNRTASLPLNFVTSRSRSDTQSSGSGSNPSGSGSNPDMGTSQLLTKLREVSHSLMFTNEATIAQELTMIEQQMFLEIKPRDWLSSAFASGKRDPDKDPVAQFWFFANRMGDWVASMILCRDKAKDRAKAVAKFVRIAIELRALNNYSGLRSVLAGIGASAGEGEACMDIFRKNDRDGKLDKALRTYTILLQPQRSHQTYRLALRQSLGAAIPAIDVHVSDLLRANEGNPDVHEEDPSLIHWAKFDMLGKFVDTLVQCQTRCRTSTEYRFKRDKLAYEIIMHMPLMTPDMQYARSIPVENMEISDPVSRIGPIPPSADAPRRESVIRRFFGR